MAKIRVAIYDEDVDYSLRLMNYLNGKYGRQIDAVAFSKKEHLMRETAEYGFDYVVTTDVEDIGAVPVIRIIEDEREDGYYRYGSAKTLAERIVTGFHSDPASMAATSRVIGVFSLSDIDRRTAFAIRKAGQLPGIYIGMEEFCTLDTTEYWMEELLFHIRQRTEDICRQIEEHLLWKDGVRYLPSARCFLDYRFLDYEDYRWFSEKLLEGMDVPVVFDIGIGSFPDFQVFSMFDTLYFLTSDAERGKRRENIFMNLLAQEVPDIHKKLIFEKEEMME